MCSIPWAVPGSSFLITIYVRFVLSEARRHPETPREAQGVSEHGVETRSSGVEVFEQAWRCRANSSWREVVCERRDLPLSLTHTRARERTHTISIAISPSPSLPPCLPASLRPLSLLPT